jgi:class 3 adenylate cyclase/tetratricopeptide (TPR) repeat protein
MSFVAKLQRAREVLEQQGRLSVRALGRELELGGDELAEIIEELVDVQRVARREENALAWSGNAASQPHGTQVAKSSAVRDPLSYTPKHLAEKILTSRSALEGERKQVTVLFADVKGSMDLAEQLDPEEWHRIMDRFFAILSEGVHRFEGTVNQYTGDGIMALFGAPIAHEDHAQRACYAALHLQQELRRYADEIRLKHGLGFSVRMGLNSGEVVVGRIGDDLRMDYTAQGHTVGLAARMEQIAAPDRAYVTEHTARLVEGQFALHDLGKLTVKGVKEHVGVYELEGLGRLRTRLEVSRARGFSKFVGRAAEVATLEAALERSLAGHGQTVGVVAEAGTGKSRLCFEFVERCRARGFTILEARGVAHGRHVPMLPMLELFRAYFGVQEHDSELAVREKIAGRLLLLDESLREDLPIFFNLLGVPDPDRPLPVTDPEALQRRTFAAVRAIVRADGQREKPAILFFEDLHWLDAASDAYLTQIIEATATTRGLNLVTFRPEYRAGWMQTLSYEQLPLVPLGAEAVRELLADLLGNDASVTGLADFVHQRAGGNPFFVEEIVQTLIETGALAGARGAYRLVRPAGDLLLPATVQAVLASRIDRLPEREKRLLQQASVIGKTFQERVLTRICGIGEAGFHAAIRTLREAEFLYEESLYPRAEYAFKHPLTQEVADRSQLKERRAETHAAIARVIEEMSADRLDEEAALIARHWEEAGENLVAARWHARAARWIGLSNYTEAFAHWRRVVALIGDTEDSSDAIRLRIEAQRTILMLGFRIKIPEDDAAAIFAAGQRDAQRLGDDVSLALLTVTYAALRQNAGAVDDYVALVMEADKLAARSGDRAAYAAVGADRFYSLHAKGWLAESWSVALEVRERSGGDVNLDTPLIGYSSYVVSYLIPPWTLVDMGRIREAEACLRRGLELAKEHGPEESRSWGRAIQVVLADAKGDRGPGAMNWARLAAEAAERAGSNHARALAHFALSLAGALDDRWDAATVHAEKTIEIWHMGFCGDFAAVFLAAHARALFGAGAVERARGVSAEAIALAKRQGQPVHQCEATIAYVRCLRALEGAKASQTIEALLEEVSQLIEQTGAERWRPHVHVERAELYRLTGDRDAARRELSEAYRLFAAMGATGHAEQVAKELAG